MFAAETCNLLVKYNRSSLQKEMFEKQLCKNNKTKFVYVMNMLINSFK